MRRLATIYGCASENAADGRERWRPQSVSGAAVRIDGDGEPFYTRTKVYTIPVNTLSIFGPNLPVDTISIFQALIINLDGIQYRI